jgi:hypothetical protein
MSDRFWIVGGEYTDTSFRHLKDGSGQVIGPFDDRQAALTAWRRVAEATRPECHTRFTIAAESAA